jgi:DNA mismatch endonuclease (patch repair protein)
MADVMTKSQRSRNMSRIRGKDTGIELRMRRALHSLGFRYRLHSKKLPGRPDIVLPKYRAAIFVNGCFWHSHGCHLSKLPKTRADFWANKLGKTVERDRANQDALRELGWRVFVVWECELGSPSSDRAPQVASTVARALTEASW